MSIRIMTLVWQHYPAGGGELLTALAYADHAHDDGTGVRPSVEYIARKTRQSERTVLRYLAKMRKEKWLVIVKRSNGRLGLTTEYRVNPLWITSPDKLTPVASEGEEEVTKEVGKGDTGGMEKVTPVSSQSSVIVKEPTTTTTQRSESDRNGNEGLPLSFPDCFQGASKASAARIISKCSIEDQQWVLDEIGGRMMRQDVRHPLGLLKKLADLAVQGTFNPSAAITFRDRHSSQGVQPNPQSDTMISTPENRRAGMAQLAALRATFTHSQKGRR